jgi:hypothetical protein
MERKELMDKAKRLELKKLTVIKSNGSKALLGVIRRELELLRYELNEHPEWAQEDLVKC